ncbi:MAG: putative esterase [Bryobacterales bacterium]|nr:putative esterase [Bryobacterales bacterium]
MIFTQFAVAQIPLPSVPCIQPAPAPPAARQAPANGPGRAGLAPRVQTPQSAEDVAELAKLRDLPAWTPAAVDGDYSAGPGFPTAPELARRVGVPEGKVIEFVMNSTESKLYPGVNGAFQRHVCVYVPAQYVTGTEAPAIIAADAYGMRYNLPTILDNMIYDQRLPAMLAIMIDNGGAERSMEYDTVSDKYVRFVEEEVLPRVEKEANVKVSKNPDARMTLGGSSVDSGL